MKVKGKIFVSDTSYDGIRYAIEEVNNFLKDKDVGMGDVKVVSAGKWLFFIVMWEEEEKENGFSRRGQEKVPF